jgi:site-specific DNA recombinase
VRVEFVNQPDLGDNPQAQLFLGVQGLFAEYERAMIKERLRLGRLYKMQTGQLLHNAPPDGYRYLPISDAGGGQWVVEEREVEVVRQLFAWYPGHEKLTIWQLVHRLNQSSTPALRRAKSWQSSVVHKMLKRTAYLGRTYFNRARILPETVGTPRTTGRGKRRIAQVEARPEEEWIAVAVPPLVEVSVWDLAQERLQMNQKFAQRNNQRHFYRRRGLLECAICGYTLQGRTQNGRVYYDCEHGGKKPDSTASPHRRHLAGSMLDPLVWEAGAELLNDPHRLADGWEAEAAQYQTTPDELGRLQARQRQLEQPWVRLIDAFQDGLLDKSEVGQRKQPVDGERQTLTERIAHLQRQHEQQAVKAQIIDNFAVFCHQAQMALHNPAPEVKQEVLRLLVQSVLVEDDAITIRHIIHTDDKCRLLPRGNRQKPPSCSVHLKVQRKTCGRISRSPLTARLHNVSYIFRMPSVRPRINHFCIKIKMRITGTIATTCAAASAP